MEDCEPDVCPDTDDEQAVSAKESSEEDDEG